MARDVARILVYVIESPAVATGAGVGEGGAIGVSATPAAASRIVAANRLLAPERWATCTAASFKLPSMGPPSMPHLACASNQ